MPPAARLGDQTQHGTPLTGAGCPTVFIDGRPAWLGLTSIHSCPLTTGTVPHVGGPVVAGSPRVSIKGQPATRQGDQITESGPPNAIAAGTPRVNIG